MKKIFIEMAFTVYCMVSATIVGWFMFLPFMWAFDDFPKWTTWILVPVALFIMATQKIVFAYFDKHLHNEHN